LRPKISIPFLEFFRRVPIWIPLTLASFFVYLYTLAPDVLDSDGGEFQFAAWNFSFVHPTGYPLFLILGGIFQHLIPNGNPAFRLNVFNAIIAACAIGALYLAAFEITHEKIWSLIAAAAFAVSRTFWFNASGVEVYALNALFLALLIFLAARWKKNPSVRTFALFCLTYGFALTHHRTIALWLPAFALYFLLTSLKVLRSGVKVQISDLRFTPYVLFFLLPLLLYAYIPFRAPVSPYYQLSITNSQSITLYDNTPQGFLNYVLGRTFAFELGWDAASAARLAMTPRLLLDQFGAMGLLLGAIGLGAIVWRRDWALLALAALGFIATIFFNAIYHIGDIAAYYLPAYLMWALLIAKAKIPNPKFQNPMSSLQALISNYHLPISALIGLLLIGFQLVGNFSAADRSHENARTQWTKILAEPIPQDAMLISNDRDEMMPLWYLQYVERTRTDVLGLFPVITPEPKYANVGRLMDSVLESGRPIYFIKPMPGIEIKYRLDASTPPLARVLGRAADAPPQHSANAVIAERVRILGYDLERGASALRISVYWQATAKLNRNYTTYVNLLSPRGGKIAQGDDHQVGGDFYPTTLWQVGETLVDAQTISLTNVPRDTYRLFVGMYAQPGLEPLGDAEIGVIEIQ